MDKLLIDYENPCVKGIQCTNRQHLPFFCLCKLPEVDPEKCQWQRRRIKREDPLKNYDKPQGKQQTPIQNQYMTTMPKVE